MKSGWKLKKLSEVAEVIMGQSPDGQSYNTEGIGIPLINGPVEFSSNSFGKTIRSKFTTQPTKLCKENDLILCVRGSTTGRMNIAGFDACIGRGVAAIRATSNQEWINYFIRFKRNEIYNIGTGATFPNVSGSSLSSFKLAFPPLPEQLRIVAILDEAFADIAAAKEKAEQNLKNAKAVFESHLQGFLAAPKADWQTKKIGDICQSIEYGTSSKSQKSGKVPVLRMGNIQDGKLDWNDLVYSDNLDEIEKYELRKGDVLFNRTNSAEHVGKTAIFRGEQKAIFAGYLIRINVKRNIVDPEFLTIYLNSRKIREYGFSVMTSSVNQANISGSKLKEYPFLMPPLSEQHQIVAQLDNLSAETSRLESLYQQKLSDLEELKKSVLQQAFSGAL